MIGIGAGNDKWDIEAEEESYEFPIIPDDNYKFHELVGKPPTPFLIFARPYNKGRLLVVDSHLGRLEDSDSLLSMVRKAFEKDTSDLDIDSTERSYGEDEEDLTIPISEKELMEKVRQSLTVGEEIPLEIEKIPLPGMGTVYSRTMTQPKRRLFARVVARKIPCSDCHNIFYVYSFDDRGDFLKFIPISISKLDNEPWDKEDLDKIRKSFKEKSLLQEIPFNAEIDAITSATISTKLVYDNMGKTNLVIQKLIALGYMTGKKE
jgi:hypothetical protein